MLVEVDSEELVEVDDEVLVDEEELLDEDEDARMRVDCVRNESCEFADGVMREYEVVDVSVESEVNESDVVVFCDGKLMIAELVVATLVVPLIALVVVVPLTALVVPLIALVVVELPTPVVIVDKTDPVTILAEVNRDVTRRALASWREFATVDVVVRSTMSKDIVGGRISDSMMLKQLLSRRRV